MPSLRVCQELMQRLEFSEIYCPAIVFVMYPAGCKTLYVIKLTHHLNLQALLTHARYQAPQQALILPDHVGTHSQTEMQVAKCQCFL